MDQLDLFSSVLVPIADDPPKAPIAPSADLTARHCSSMGSLKTETFRSSMWARMLAFYRLGPATDAEMAAMLSLPDDQCSVVHPSTVSARRKELIQQGKVDPVSCGTRKNPRTGVRNSLWKLNT